MKKPSSARRSWHAPLVVLSLLLSAAATARAQQPAPPTGPGLPLVGLTSGNRLIFFNSESPGTVSRAGSITGLPASETVVGIDFRPATGQLYGLGSSGRLYVINPATLKATAAGSGNPGAPLDAATPFGVGMDFNPVADRVRVVTDRGQNLRIDPEPRGFGGGVTADARLAYAAGDVNAGQAPSVVAIAYTNSGAGGAAVTTLYGIDAERDALVRVAPPNAGQLGTVGALGVNTQEVAGLDIAPASRVAYAVLTTALSPTGPIAPHLYRVSLVTGAATFVGSFGSSNFVIDIAVVPPQFTVFALGNANELLTFNSSTPETVISRTPIKGMLPGEQMFELDFRPAGGQLYGLGRVCCTTPSTVSHLYTINTETALATPVSAAPITPGLSGDAGFDFNPVADRLRIVTQTGQNLRVHPDTGAVVTVDTPLAYAAGDPEAGRAPNVSAAAYTDSFPGATSTTLYDIDLRGAGSFNTTLARQGSPGGSPVSPNAGQLFTVGTISGVGVPVDFAGFDIAHGARAPAFATFISENDADAKFYAVSLSTGAAFFVADVGGGSLNGGSDNRLRDIAVAPSGAFEFAADLFTVTEGCTAAEVTVMRTGDTTNEATVDFATADVGGIQPASSRSDYNAASGTLFFAAGQGSATFRVLVNEDARDEKLQGAAGEIFGVTLTNPTNGFTLGARRAATVRIDDDEDGSASAPNPIDDTATFVCQHYHDFLNREPDAAGLAFWTNNIESCGANADCRQGKRTDTSAAFFLSIEFQQTGFLVYRVFAAAFGPTRIGGAVPLTLAEFLPDTQRIGRGVVIGEPAASETLEENKRAFFDDFVSRAVFTARYPATLSAAQFVDALNQNAGGALSAPERDDLAGRLSSGQVNRADALRAVAEDADLRAREFNRAFVLEQYFGYLRRNPDDPPEPGLNFDGYNFWLRKLNEFGGDFRRAEMVKSFIISGEYRGRFSAR